MTFSLRIRGCRSAAVLAAAALLWMLAAAGHAETVKTPPRLLEGMASWYGEFFQGRPTASGEPFDMNALTAAHMTLPLGSIVRVVNLENGKTVIVRINDRGPFKKQYVIDLSRQAAVRLDMLQKGTARVRIEPLDRNVIDGEAPQAVVPAAIRRTAQRNATGDEQKAVSQAGTAPAGGQTGTAQPAAGQHDSAEAAAAAGETKAGMTAAVSQGRADSSVAAPIAERDGVASPDHAPQGGSHAKEPVKEQQAQPAANSTRQALAVAAAITGADHDKAAHKTVLPEESGVRDGNYVKKLPSGVYVQAGAFSRRENARNFAQQLEKEGFGPVLWSAKNSAGSLWLVVAGPFADKAQAYNRLAALRNAGHNGYLKVVAP
jgi:rare lipoprotein A